MYMFIMMFSFCFCTRCYFAQHDKTMLIGADPSHVGDRCIRVTIHHCFFDGTRQRQPRLRFGKVHLYNNYTRNWGIYAVCASVESQVKMILVFINKMFCLQDIWSIYIISNHYFFFLMIVVYFYDYSVRYFLNAIYMKQDRRKRPLNIIQRR